MAIYKKIHKILNVWVLLERIKYVPWFSVLLLCMLGFGGYQVAHRSSYDHWLTKTKQSITHFISSTNSELFNDKKKTTHADQIHVSNSQIPLIASSDNKQEGAKWVTLEKKLQKLDNEYTRLARSYDELKKDWEIIRSNTDNMTQKLNDLEKQIVVEAHTSPVLLSSNGHIYNQFGSPRSECDYSVHAIIQGRAWLNTPDDKIITVSVGSQIFPYGIVQEIDADNGLVYFENDHVIGFSTNDG